MDISIPMFYTSRGTLAKGLADRSSKRALLQAPYLHLELVTTPFTAYIYLHLCSLSVFICLRSNPIMQVVVEFEI